MKKIKISLRKAHIFQWFYFFSYESWANMVKVSNILFILKDGKVLPYILDKNSLTNAVKGDKINSDNIIILVVYKAIT